MEIEIGQLINKRYRVEKYLGRGGMSEVYRVLDTMRSTPLAMKVLHADLAEDIVFVRRFKREAQTLAKLQHPNIVRFYGFEQVSDTAMILMEYVDGTTLRNVITKEKKPFSAERVLEIMKPVCAALHYAHQMGMVHCDVKPANIMIKQNGEVLLADFGIARLAESSSTATMVGSGTPAYMSPEQIRGENPTPQTDIYALGSVLYELFTGGERPFTGDEARTTGTTAEKVRWEKMNLEAPSPRKYNKGLSPSLEGLILRCLAHDPRDRFMSVMELLQALEKDSHGEMGKVPNVKVVEEVKPPKGKASKPISTKSGKPILIGAGAILLVTILLVAGITLITKGRTGKITENKVETQIVIEEPNEPDQVTPTIPVTPTIMPSSEVISAANIDRLVELGRYGSPIINDLVVSPAGREFIGATSHGIIIYDAATMAELRRIDTGGWANCLAISSDTVNIAVGMSDKTVLIFRLSSGELVKKLEGHTNPVISIAYTQDGEHLVSASSERIQVWSTDEYAQVRSIQLPVAIYKMKLSPDNRTAATYTGTGEYYWWDRGASNQFDLWDIQTGALLRTQKVYNGAITDLVFAFDGQRLLTGDGSGRVDEWRVEPFQRVRTVFQQNEWVSHLVVTSDNKRIITSSSTYRYVRVFNYADEKLIEGLGESGVDELLINNITGVLVSASSDGYIKAWQMDKWTEITYSENSIAPFCKNSRCFVIDQDGYKLASFNANDQKINILTLPEMTLLDSYVFHFMDENSWYYSVSPGGKYVIYNNYSSNSEEITYFRIGDSQPIASVKANSIQFIRDDQEFVIITQSGVDFYDSLTGTRITSVPLEEAVPYGGIYAQNERYIYVYYWQTAAGSIIDAQKHMVISNNITCSEAVFIGTSSDLLCWRYGEDISIIDADSGKANQIFVDNYPNYYSKSFVMSADLLVIDHSRWDVDPIIEFYNMASGKLLKTMSGPQFRDAQVIFNMDGRRVFVIRGPMVFVYGIN